LAELAAGAISDSGTAYAIAKRANQVRVRTSSLAWGLRGARVNSISPGIIATPLGAAELDGPHGEIMRAMIAASGTGRIGTPEDIAAAVGFLISPDAAFITGTDLLVDGGVVASVLTPKS
jgi:NAD(P)-dependent dehydrogenase (short-subunit alcohol dehydrogenase family)